MFYKCHIKFLVVDGRVCCVKNKIQKKSNAICYQTDMSHVALYKFWARKISPLDIATH